MKRLLLFLTCVLTLFGVGRAENKADFPTMNSGNANNSYATYTSTNGWKAENSQLVKINNEVAPTLNGKTSAKGVITSPTLKDGVGTISFKYQNTFNETKGVSVKIDIKQNGSVVYTENCTNSSVVKSQEYSFTTKPINKEGDFVIEITNLSPSNNTSNADRVSIYDLTWTNYSKSEEGDTKTNANLSFDNRMPSSLEIGSLLDLSEYLKNTVGYPGPYEYTITTGNNFATLNGSKLEGNAVGYVTVKASIPETNTQYTGEATATIEIVAATGGETPGEGVLFTDAIVTDNFSGISYTTSKNWISPSSEAEYSAQGSIQKNGFQMRSNNGGFIYVDKAPEGLKVSNIVIEFDTGGGGVTVYSSDSKITTPSGTALKTGITSKTSIDINAPYFLIVPTNNNLTIVTKVSVNWVADSGTENPEPGEYSAPFDGQTYTFTEGQTVAKIDFGDGHPTFNFNYNPVGIITIDNDGNVTINSKGRTTVSATWDSDDTWKASSETVTFTVVVNENGEVIEPEPGKTSTYMFDFTQASTINELNSSVILPATTSSGTTVNGVEFTKNGISVSTTKGTSNDAVIWLTTTENTYQYRIYKGAKMTIKANSNITKIEFAGGNNYVGSGHITPNVGTLSQASSNKATWEGDAREIVFTVGDSQNPQINTIEVTISSDESELTPVTLQFANSTISVEKDAVAPSLPELTVSGASKDVILNYVTYSLNPIDSKIAELVNNGKSVNFNTSEIGEVVVTANLETNEYYILNGSAPTFTYKVTEPITDPGEEDTIETTITASSFGYNDSSYDLKDFTDEKGFTYASVLSVLNQSGNQYIQYNTKNEKGGAGSALAVTSSNSNYIIESITFDFNTSGPGFDIYKSSENFESPKLNTPYVIPEGLEAVQTAYKNNDPIEINDNAFLIVPNSTGAISFSSLTVKYRKIGELDPSEDPSCDEITASELDKLGVLNAQSYKYVEWTSPSSNITFGIGSMFDSSARKEFRLNNEDKSGVSVVNNPNNKYLDKIEVVFKDGSKETHNLSLYKNEEHYSYNDVDNKFTSGDDKKERKGTDEELDYIITPLGNTSATIIENPLYWYIQPDKGALYFESIKFYYVDSPRQEVEMSFDKPGIEVKLGDDLETLELPELIDSEGIPVIYSSSDESVATVDPESGKITSILSTGATIIKASVDMENTPDHYGEAEYSLIILDNVEGDYLIIHWGEEGYSYENGTPIPDFKAPDAENGPVSLDFDKGTHTNTAPTYYEGDKSARFYKGNTLEISLPKNYKLMGVDMYNTNDKNSDFSISNATNGVLTKHEQSASWRADDESDHTTTFTYDNATRIHEMVVYYKKLGDLVTLTWTDELGNTLENGSYVECYYIKDDMITLKSEPEEAYKDFIVTATSNGEPTEGVNINTPDNENVIRISCIDLGEYVVKVELKEGSNYYLAEEGLLNIKFNKWNCDLSVMEEDANYKWSSMIENIDLGISFNDDLFDKDDFEVSIKPYGEFAKAEGESDMEVDDWFDTDDNIIIDWKDDLRLDIMVPCSGLYEFTISYIDETEEIGGSVSKLINIYPSMEGLELDPGEEFRNAYKDNKDIDKFGPFKMTESGLDYTFIRMNENVIHEASAKPIVNLPSEGVTVYYWYDGIDEVMKADNDKKSVKALADSDSNSTGLENYYQADEENRINIGGMLNSSSGAPVLHLVLSKNGATTPFESTSTGSSAPASLNQININFDSRRDVTVGIGSIEVEGNGEVEYYDLNGVKINADRLEKGIYIKVENGKASKVVL